MISHLSVGTNDIARAKRFYDATLAVLGYRRLFDRPTAGAWGTDFPIFWAGLPLDGKPAHPGNGVHVCFHAANRQVVDDFHRAALAAGGSDDGKPGLRAEYTADYYAAFVRDPDGNKIEAVCFLNRRWA
jgi:catechol 2,3-dioxygenase-like lactoylglutathione lyase family enzyme